MRTLATLAHLLVSALLFAPLPLHAKDAAKPARPASTAKPAGPAERAALVADQLPMVKRAIHGVHLMASELKHPALRAAVEAQLASPWLTPDTFALTHKSQAEQLLRKEHLLADADSLVLPEQTKATFDTAPGGPCPTGHHAYPGGLAVHSWTNALHARAMADVYEKVHGVKLEDDLLIAAALWHDSLKVATLPWDANGTCPSQEPQVAGTALHHILGIANAISRHLPRALVWSIASAHAPPAGEWLPKVCAYLRAGAIVAVGNPDAVACPSLTEGKKPPIEAFITHFVDADYPLTVPSWGAYASATPSGWARFSALAQDGSDLLVWSRTQETSDR